MEHIWIEKAIDPLFRAMSLVNRIKKPSIRITIETAAKMPKLT